MFAMQPPSGNFDFQLVDPWVATNSAGLALHAKVVNGTTMTTSVRAHWKEQGSPRSTGGGLRSTWGTFSTSFANYIRKRVHENLATSSEIAQSKWPRQTSLQSVQIQTPGRNLFVSISEGTHKYWRLVMEMFGVAAAAKIDG
jgi:hypothetical protein